MKIKQSTPRIHIKTLHFTKELKRKENLADILQDDNGALEVANMEDRQLQVNVAIVTNAVSQGLATHLTADVLLAGALTETAELALPPSLFSAYTHYLTRL